MLVHASLLRAGLALAAAAALAVEGAGESAVQHEGDGFTLTLPASWSRTVHLGCPAAEDDCLAEARFGRPDGAWVRVVVDPPGAPHRVDAAVRARVTPDGRLRPEAPIDAPRRRVVALTARAGGREYLVLVGSGGEEDLPEADLEAVLSGFRVG